MYHLFQANFVLAILSRVGIGFGLAPSSHLEKDPKFFLISKMEKWPYPQTWNLSKILHDRIFGPKILHTKNA